MEAPQAQIVVDSSVTVAWCFPDEQDAYAQTALDALTEREAIVPALWPIEVANALLMGERKNQSTQADTTQWLQFLSDLPIQIDEETSERASGATLALARGHGLSVYDATYLELSLRRRLPLATLDERLRVAAKAVGVDLFVAPAQSAAEP